MTERSAQRIGRQPTGLRWKPGVSSVNDDTKIFAEFIAGNAPRSFLDVGTGTGYLAIRLALGGSFSTATDVSAAAVSLAERNAGRNGVKLSVRISDLFDRVNGTYDAIAFNPPFSAGSDGLFVSLAKQFIRRIGPLERMLMRHMPAHVDLFRRALIGRFIEEGRPHLTSEGAFYLLLYTHEVARVGEIAPGFELTEYSPAQLRARNLSCVRLSRPEASR